MRAESIKLSLLPMALAGQLLLPSLGMAAPAEPETTTSGGLEEIVVTATRREERLQDVPISVLAFSREKLDQQGLKNIDDLARLAPGLTFQRNGFSSSGNYNDEGSDISIRGIDSTAGTGTTGIYIDDSPIQTRHIGFGSINAFPAVFDLDRIEVLRGPQGTLFGAGAEGGVVRFISPDPDLNKPTGYARVDFANTDGGTNSYEGGGAFGAPIIDDVLAFRASVSYRRDGGWIDKVGYTLSPGNTPYPLPPPTPVYNGVTTESNANSWETTTARLALKWKVTDALEITPSIYYQHLLISDTAAYWMALSNASANIYRNGNAGSNPSSDPFTLSAIRVKWDLGFASLFSNTSYYDRNQRATSDYTQYLRATWNSFGELPNTFPPAGANGYATFKDTQRNFYEEIRLASNDTNARLLWSGGLFYSRLSENGPENIIDPTLYNEVFSFYGPNPPVPVCTTTLPCPGGLIFQGPVDHVVDKQIAVFGELTFKFTDTLKATAGLRVSKIDFTGSVAETGPFLGDTIITESSATEHPVTPKAVLTWQPDHDNMVYASAAKGFRPGGVNVGVSYVLCGPNLSALGLSQVPGQFSSDNLWSYEIGTKNVFLEHTLEINASLYYISWNNIQQNVYLSACGEQFTANLGKAKSEGGDITVLYKPVPALTFEMSAAYSDAKLTKSSCAGSLVFDAASDACEAAGQTPARPIATNGDALLGAPWSFTGSVEYQLPEWNSRKPYVRLDYQHSTAQTSRVPIQDGNNAIIDTTLPGLPIVNNLSARAGMRFNGFDLSVYGNNLTNAHPLMFEARDIYPYPGAPGTGTSQNGPTTDTLYFGRGVRPRTIGLTATYRY
jgi:iron complex outermembrane receptor protein